MARTTRKQIEAVLEQLCERVNVPFGYVPGGWFVSNNPTYGGYVVRELIPGSSGEREPFGAVRRPPREMIDALRFARDAATLARRV